MRSRLCLPAAMIAALLLIPQLPAQTLITEPDAGLAPIYNLITSARKSLDMTMYELTDTRAEQLLAQAAAAGVTVRVILDQNLEMSSNQAAYTYLAANRVAVHWANPAYAATHQKSITVDGEVSAIMTLNLTSQYYSTSRDFAVIDNNPGDVAALENTFNADFENLPVMPLPGSDLVWSPTTSQANLLSLIEAARYTLQVENEEMSDSNVVAALAAAAARGVLVEITMTNDANEYSAEFNQLTAARAKVSTYAETAALYIHAKVILADYGKPGAQVFIGSQNFSVASLTENRELGTIIANESVMTAVQGVLSGDFRGATPWKGTAPGFSLTANPAAVRLAPGGQTTAVVTTTLFGGFSGGIALSASGLPAGVSASFSGSTLILSAAVCAAAGSYTITMKGMGGGLTETANVGLIVTSGATPGFSVSANPAAGTASRSNAATMTIGTATYGGFSAPITLTATGLPSGVMAGFNPSSISAPGAGSSLLTLTALSSAAAGTYTIAIQAAGKGLTEQTHISLTIAPGSPNQLVTDGGFESATQSGLAAPGWSATTNQNGQPVIVVDGVHPHTGINYASLGGMNNDNETLTQTIAIPAGANSALLTFWVNITTQETYSRAYDFLYVEIHNMNGTLLATPLTLNNTNSTSDGNTAGVYFESPSVDLSSFAGQTIELVFHATNDYEKPTTFLIDDVSLTTV